MVKKHESPAAIRSKHLLANALLTLMKGKPYNKITIKEITQESGLARITFYNNFTSKEDILIYHFNNLAEEYLEIIRDKTEMNAYSLVRDYFAFWKEKRDFLIDLLDSDFLFLIKHSEEHFNTIIKEFFTSNEESSYDFNPYINSFIVGGLTNMLQDWAKMGFEEDVDKLAGYFVRYQEILGKNE